MKHRIVFCILVVVASVLQACETAREGKPGETYSRYSGQVVSTFGRPVPAAWVEVNGIVATADRNGRFALQVPSATRYVVNIRKRGYGLVSRIYTSDMEDAEYTLPRATTRSIDPAKRNTVMDTASEGRCLGMLRNRIGRRHGSDTRKSREGTADISKHSPAAALRRALAFDADDIECSKGISIAIPANALVDAAGKTPSGKVDVLVTTAVLSVPDGLPGDGTAEDKDGLAFLQSVGAGTIDVTAGTRVYGLKPGMSATLIVPVDANRLQTPGAEIPKELPFFSYDTGSGRWRREGTARLNAKGDAYVATIWHLSAYSMGFAETSPSCVKFETAGFDRPYELVAAYIYKGHVESKKFDIAAGLRRFKVLYNLPNDALVGMMARWSLDGRWCPITDPELVNSGPPHGSFVNPPPYPYNACRQSRIPRLVQWTEWPWAPVLTREVVDTNQGLLRYQITLDWTYDFRDCAVQSPLVRPFSVQEWSGNGWRSVGPVHAMTKTLLRRAGTYRYRVRALDSGLHTRWSNTVQVRVPTPVPLPTPIAPPTGLVATAKSSATVQLTWQDTDGESMYLMKYREPADSEWQDGGTRLAEAVSETITETVTLPNSGTTYHFQVDAVPEAGGMNVSSNVAMAATGYDIRGTWTGIGTTTVYPCPNGATASCPAAAQAPCRNAFETLLGAEQIFPITSNAYNVSVSVTHQQPVSGGDGDTIEGETMSNISVGSLKYGFSYKSTLSAYGTLTAGDSSFRVTRQGNSFDNGVGSFTGHVSYGNTADVRYQGKGSETGCYYMGDYDLQR